MKKAELNFNLLLIFLDFLMFISAGLAAYFLRTNFWLQALRPAHIFFNYFSLSRYLPIVIATSLLWLIIFGFLGLYRLKANQGFAEEFLKIVIACSAGMTAVVIYIFFRRELFDSRFIILFNWLFAIILVSISRLIIRKIWLRYGLGVRQTLLIGNGTTTKKIRREIEKNPQFKYKVIKELPSSTPQSLESIFQNEFFDEIVLCDPGYPRKEIIKLVDFCEECQIDFKFVPDLFQAFFANIEIGLLGDSPIIELTRTSLDGGGKATKRLVDIGGSILGLIASLPFWPLIGLAIKINSPGPAIVRLKRVNQGREFFIYKFRSMQNEAHNLKPSLSKHNERNDGPFFKIKNDPRTTQIGKFIRRTRIDELPQLINVLKGEMSLVGPRPHEPEEIAQYQKHHKRTLLIKPGMTGLAQITGSSDLEFEEEIKLDTYYIKNWSLLYDLKILLKTIAFILKDNSTY